MKTKEKLNPVTSRKRIKVQLDDSTYATISRMSSLKIWQKRFPAAKIMV